MKIRGSSAYLFLYNKSTEEHRVSFRVSLIHNIAKIFFPP